MLAGHLKAFAKRDVGETMLASVGPDGQDQNGTKSVRLLGFEAQSVGAFEDIVFALPPDPPLPKAPEPPAPAPGG